MAENSSRSVAEIRRETERSRAALSSTVQDLKEKVTETAEEWRQRVSPDAIKSDVKDYISTRSNEFTSSLVQAAKDNPLQALAVGAGVAMPALKLLKSVPMPILLIGAGLFLSNTKKGRELSEQAREAMSDAASAATRKMHDLQDAVASTVDTGLGKLDSAKSAITEKVQSLKAQASDVSESAVGAVQDLASRAPSVADTKNAAQSVSGTLQSNALLVAGIGVAIGGFLASVLPKSDAERRLLGNAADKLKEQAQGVVTNALDTARNAAVSSFDGLASKAAEKGLSPEALADAAADIGGRVRHVADAAATAATGDRQSKTQGQDH